MKKESRELASQLLEVTNEALGPVYNDLRAKLMGSLATSSVHIESLREESTQRAANRELLEHFRTLLPQAEAWKSNRHTWNSDGNFSVLSAPDAFTAKAILVNTVWHSNGVFNSEGGFRYYPHDYKPFYIVGVRKSLESKRYSDVLLLSGDKENTGLKHLLVKTSDLQEVKRDQNSYFHADFTQKEVDQIYNHNTGLLNLMSTSPGAVHTSGLGFNRPDTLRLTPHNYGFKDVIAQSGPTDDELAQFQVPEHLNNLATLFDIVEQYQKILATAKP